MTSAAVEPSATMEASRSLKAADTMETSGASATMEASTNTRLPSEGVALRDASMIETAERAGMAARLDVRRGESMRTIESRIPDRTAAMES